MNGESHHNNEIGIFFLNLGVFQNPFAVEAVASNEFVARKNIGKVRTDALKIFNNHIGSVPHAVNDNGKIGFFQ